MRDSGSICLDLLTPCTADGPGCRRVLPGMGAGTGEPGDLGALLVRAAATWDVHVEMPESADRME